ncbi:hypothetical protein DFP73DRAFT_77015 [Morchella snyderi]|nr:hypothetical protein DFP73DRAFT_77015 [Morchella snyderi]
MRHEPATTVLRSVAPQAPPPLSEEMRQLAEDTSVMLELIGKTDPDENTGMDNDYKQIIDDAFENVGKIRTQYRVALASRLGSVNLTQDPAPIVDDKLKIDSACIICCDEISNTVLLPCNHLVLCMVCKCEYTAHFLPLLTTRRDRRVVRRWESKGNTLQDPGRLTVRYVGGLFWIGSKSSEVDICIAESHRKFCRIKRVVVYQCRMTFQVEYCQFQIRR